MSDPEGKAGDLQNCRIGWEDDTSYYFGENGGYLMNISVTPGQGNWELTLFCPIKVTRKPDAQYMPIFWAFIFFLLLQFSWSVGKTIYTNEKWKKLLFGKLIRSNSQTDFMIENDKKDETIEPKPAQKRRLKSLDAFRGLAIVIMIFVNYGGGGIEFLVHNCSVL